MNLFPGQFRIHGQREKLRGATFGHRERAGPVLQRAIGFLEMDRNGVMNSGLDPTLLHSCRNFIPIIAAHHEQMVHMVSVRLLGRQNQIRVRKPESIAICKLAPPRVPRR